MIFTSFTFIIFFVIVFSLYWQVRGLDAKQYLLLLASVVFYGWWDYRFIALIAVVVAVSYLGARLLERPTRRRLTLGLAIGLLLAILSLFKYADFLYDSLVSVLTFLGANPSPRGFSVILPVGISFFTFHGISYLVDVYRGNIRAERSVARVALYILFFPQLIAGPIVRASNFMPQLAREPQFDSDEIIRGAKLFLVGFLYKTVLADSIAPYVDEVYGDLLHHGPADQVLATLGFYAQIYFDFAGYSIMAIGLSRTLGYRLPRNFDFPYISTSITGFWRRWHISLSSWLRDYLYISLGGNRDGLRRQLVNIMITMLLGGLWHGASWNFLIWGGLHGMALCVHKLYLGWRPSAKVSMLSRVFSATPIAWLVTQLFVLLCWAPFRAQDMGQTLSVWSSYLRLRWSDLGAVNWQMLALIATPLLVDSLLVSGKVKIRIPGWQTYFANRPWRVAAAMGTIFGLALLVVPLTVRSFIYFKF